MLTSLIATVVTAAPSTTSRWKKKLPLSEPPGPAVVVSGWAASIAMKSRTNGPAGRSTVALVVPIGKSSIATGVVLTSIVTGSVAVSAVRPGRSKETVAEIAAATPVAVISSVPVARVIERYVWAAAAISSAT